MGILGWITGILLFLLAYTINGVIRTVEHNESENVRMAQLAAIKPYKPINLKV